MEWIPTATFFGPMALTIAISYAFNLLARRVAPYVGLIDHPDGGRKTHRQATPVMGGVAFTLAILAVFVASHFLHAPWLADDSVRRLVMSLAASTFCYCLLGVCDDRWPLSPRIKLAGQILASLPFVFLNGSVQSVGILGWELSLGSVGGPITVLWLVGCANVVNLIDGLDGLAGSIGVVVMITIATLFELQGHHAEALITTVIAGGVIGFLCHNWPPAKIFMGDAGSMTIGFLAGALSIQASSKTATSFTLGVPLVLMSIPMFDTVMAMLRRRLTGRSIGEGDRGHIHHRLQDRGLTRQQALLAIAGLTLIMSGAALLSVLYESETIGLAICAGVLVMLILGRIFGYHETSLVFRHLKEIGDLLVESSGLLQTRFLLARVDSLQPQQQAQLWDEVIKRATQMQATRLEYSCRAIQDDRITTRLSWENYGHDPIEHGAQWQIVYRIPREDGLMATWEARGSHRDSQDPPRVDQLLLLFAKVGLALPTNDARLPVQTRSESQNDMPSILFPQPILPESVRHAA